MHLIWLVGMSYIEVCGSLSCLNSDSNGYDYDYIMVVKNLDSNGYDYDYDYTMVVKDYH